MTEKRGSDIGSDHMMEHFCTYFDHRYLPKGLAMWRSLKEHQPDAILHTLCLSQPCYEILSSLQLPDVHLYPLRVMEDADPKLLEARATRSLIEYYFTLTPCLPRYLLRTVPSLERITYVDADLFFFADPQPIFDEIGDRAIGVVEHRFTSGLAHLEQYGRFNVGWLTFRAACQQALECLDAWREQCLGWCYDRLEGERFAEQKYLDTWPSRFPSLAVVQHKGANVAPWNLDRFPLSLVDGCLSAGDQPLLFFHAHGFKTSSPGREPDFNLEMYGASATSFLRTAVLDPYNRAVIGAASEIALPLALALASDPGSHDAAPVVGRLEARVALLEARIREIDADRSSRLEAIGRLQDQLARSEADRAARLDAIHSLHERLGELTGEREAAQARADLLHAQLTTLEAMATEARSAFTHAEAVRQAMEGSRSWRWTAPFRRILSAVRR